MEAIQRLPFRIKARSHAVAIDIRHAYVSYTSLNCHLHNKSSILPEVGIYKLNIYKHRMLHFLSHQMK